MTNTSTALELNHITKVFGPHTGLFDVSASIQDHTVTAIIGPNGSGKTTLFSIISGLASPDSGSVEHAPGAHLSYCPDVPRFDNWLTALEVLQQSMSLAGKPVDNDLILSTLEFCGLKKVTKRSVANFSRGMLQRLGIAANLVLNPDLLILDEPTSALDPLGKADIKALIRKQKEDRAIVVSSHSLYEVEAIADYIIVLFEGKIIQQGTTSEVIASGNTPPEWILRFAHPVESVPVLVPMSLPQGVELTRHDDSSFLVKYESLEQGQQNLPSIIQAFNLPIQEVTLAERDLDSAFSRILEHATPQEPVAAQESTPLAKLPAEDEIHE